LNLQSEIGFGFHAARRSKAPLRIRTAASRRGIDTPCVQAEPNGQEHKVTLLREVNQK
jgi:hypothetical protein